MSEHIVKRHNKTLLLFHLVCPVRYRRKVFSKDIEQALRQTCLEISERYEIHFVEIGTDQDHAHFLIQTVPMMLPTRFVQITKSITAKEIFRLNPGVKQMLWGGKFWTSGYYLNTVGQYANEEAIKNYVKNQGKTYNQIYRGQLTFFEDLP